MALECSVVVPLCNEAENLPTLHVRLTAALRHLAIPYEIIYVDDGSTDQTAGMIADLHEEDSTVKGVLLSRNFGHQAALWAGLEAATGRAVISMDGDLQDPPELIPELIDKWRDGYEVVFARRRRRREHPAKRVACFIFYRLLGRLSEVPIPLDTGDFTLMDRRAVEELISLPERTGFIRGLRSWIGFKRAEVQYDRDVRLNGRSKYTFSRLVRLAMDGMFAFSETPLKLIAMLGCLVIVLALGGFVAGATGKGGFAAEAAGLLCVGSALGLLGGVQLACLGIMGAYMTRIYREVRARPRYMTRERIGFRPLPRPVPNVLDFLPTAPAERQERATASRLSDDWRGERTVGDSTV